MTATLTELDAPGVGDRSETRRIPLPLALLAASLPMFMATLDNLVMTSALPVIQRSLPPTSRTSSGSSTRTPSASRL